MYPFVKTIWEYFEIEEAEENLGCVIASAPGKLVHLRLILTCQQGEVCIPQEQAGEGGREVPFALFEFQNIFCILPYY